MKKLLYFVFSAIFMIGCGQSLEKKAEVLIKEDLKKSLYKPETYEPIETKIDSAFSPYDDPVFFEEINKFEKMAKQMMSLESKAKHAKSSMAIWNSPYMSEYAKNQYQEAKSEYEDVMEKFDRLTEKARKQYLLIMDIIKGDRTFISYKALHNYRADNNAGNTLIGNMVFFIDKDFKNILFSMDLEEYNVMQETIKQIEERLEEPYDDI